jgi:hypothetical protein
MASKYAHLKGQIPIEEVIYSPEVAAFMKEYAELDPTPGERAKRYNTLNAEAVEMAGKVKVLNQKLEAAEANMLQSVDSNGIDSIKADGYTWTPTFEPYPSCEDPEAIVKYLKRKKMGSMLVLKVSELASRLRQLVKDEAANNELRIDVVSETDPITGEVKERRIVRSRVPGVKVFLKAKLSRVKSS